MNAQGSSRTVLLDVGGVLVDAHPDPHAIAELFGDGSRCLTTLVDQAMWTHRGEYDAGMSDREFWDRIAGDCGQPEPSSALLKELVALDASRMATANEETIHLVRQLRRQAVRVGILSNAPYPIAKAIRRSEWGSLLDVPHEEVIFIDDRRENVRAAELLSVKGIVWKGVEDAETRLKELGVLF